MTASRAMDASRALVVRLQEILERRTGRPVALMETHISWVLLTHRLALKLKKPLCLSFLDFGSVALRRRACDEELRLNRRLAPGLYRRVLAVRGTRDAPTLGGAGEDIDAVVCMRRFPDGALLRERIACGRLLPWHVDRLAGRIARFHEAAEIVRDGGGDAAERAAKPVEAVLAQLAVCQPAPWNAVAARWLAGRRLALAPAWRERGAGGAIRECHGDLHLANAVVLGEDVTAFDCIEFDPALRRVDMMSDVAFMTMDLQAHGRPDLAHRFLDAYLEGRGDYGGLCVLRFYETYRALVRAFVGRLSPPAASASPDYLDLATRWMAQPDETPRLAILCGLAGSGKSTFASRLVRDTGAVRVRSDVERKRLFGLAPRERAGEGVELYAEDATVRTYRRLEACAREALAAGFAVVVDAAFLAARRRCAFRDLAAALDVPFAIFFCHADEAVLRRRVAARAAADDDASDADGAVLARQTDAWEPPAGDEMPRVIDVDTDPAPDIAALATRWRSMSA